MAIRKKRVAAVTKLNRIAPPHPSRITQIQNWHTAQAVVLEDHSVAILHLAISEVGLITTTFLAVEPAQAEAFLAELVSVITALTLRAKGIRG